MMVSRVHFPLLASALAVGPSLIGQDPVQESKTVLPVGKPEVGQSLFVEKGCYHCHSAGETKLGGDLHAKWTRDDYARAIMDPNHLVSEDYRIAMMRLGDNFKAENSPMPDFGDLLRVSDLIHLATFLDSLTD